MRHFLNIRSLYLFILVLPAISATAQITRFEAGAEAYGIEDVSGFTGQYGNGLSAADFDRDGDIDLLQSLKENTGGRDGRRADKHFRRRR